MKKMIIIMMILCICMFILAGCSEKKAIIADRPNVDKQAIAALETTPLVEAQKPIEALPVPVVTKAEEQKPESSNKPMPKPAPKPAPVVITKPKPDVQTTMTKASLIKGKGKFATLARANIDNFFIHGFAKTKRVTLTFDDGPDPELTPKLLDILKENNVKASFFLVGNRIDSAPEVVKRAYNEGHLI